MLKYHARELAAMTPEQRMALDEGQPPQAPMQVVFDDGVLDTTIRKTIWSSYMWGMYVDFPKTPALIEHHIGTRRLGMETHLTLLNKVMWAAYDAYGGMLDVEELCRYVYKAINRMYNELTYALEAHVGTISIFDFIAVTEHPKIKEIVANTAPSAFAIDNYAYPKAKEILLNPKELPNNAISIACRNGLVSMGQVLQTTVIRGAAADVDSRIFPHPIMGNFTSGLTKIHDSMIESRSAAKALSFTQEPLQQVEYFNRKMQLMASVVMRLHPGDCGSQHYMRWYVNSGDLGKIAGKYYKTDEGLRPIREGDGHLIGQPLLWRSPLLCQHPDPQGICTTCMGELSLSVPRGTNPGHFAATALGEQGAQTVLSTKHLDANALVTAIELSEFEQRYLRTDDDPNIIKLAQRLRGMKVLLTINAKEAPQVQDVTYVEDVTDLQTGQISSLTGIELTIHHADGTQETVPMTVNVGSRHSSLTHEALDYMKNRGWELNVMGNYVIDLTDWNIEWPLFELPMRHANMLDFITTIEKFMRASATPDDSAKTLRDYKTIEEALRAFYDLVTSQLMVNVVHLEILMKSLMVRSEKDLDYRMPLIGNKLEFGAFDTTMERRSMSGSMAYEKHRHVITDVQSYLVNHRPDHVFDTLMEG